MSAYLLFIILTLILTCFYYIAKKRSLLLVDGDIKKLHSLPTHYGWAAGVNSFIPGFIILAIWTISKDSLINKLLISQLGSEAASLPAFELNVLLDNIKNYVSNGTGDENLAVYAEYYRTVSEKIAWSFFLASIGASCIVGYYTLYKMSPKVNSRNHLETIISHIALYIF